MDGHILRFPYGEFEFMLPCLQLILLRIFYSWSVKAPSTWLLLSAHSRQDFFNP
jgi:hypothetical protein